MKKVSGLKRHSPGLVFYEKKNASAFFLFLRGVWYWEAVTAALSASLNSVSTEGSCRVLSPTGTAPRHSSSTSADQPLPHPDDLQQGSLHIFIHVALGEQTLVTEVGKDETGKATNMIAWQEILKI